MIIFLYSFLIVLILFWLISLCSQSKFNYFICSFLFIMLFMFFNNFMVFFFIYEVIMIPLLFIYIIQNVPSINILSRSLILLFYFSYFLTFLMFLCILLNFFISFSLLKMTFLFIFFLTFVFKAPLFPFMNWLLWLHVYSDSFLSAILAGIYLKLSALIFIICFSLLNCYLMLFLILISIFNVLISWIYEIITKRLIALASIFHWSFGLFFLIMFNSSISYLGILFFLLHLIHAFCAWSLFFLFGFLISSVLRKTEYSFYHNLSYSYIWLSILVILIIYFSFPLFVSFFLEIFLLSSSFSFNIVIIFTSFIFGNFVLFYKFLKFIFFSSVSLIKFNVFGFSLRNSIFFFIFLSYVFLS